MKKRLGLARLKRLNFLASTDDSDERIRTKSQKTSKQKWMKSLAQKKSKLNRRHNDNNNNHNSNNNYYYYYNHNNLRINNKNNHIWIFSISVIRIFNITAVMQQGRKTKRCRPVSSNITLLTLYRANKLHDLLYRSRFYLAVLFRIIEWSKLVE